MFIIAILEKVGMWKVEFIIYFLLKYNLHIVKFTDFKYTVMSFVKFYTCVTHTLVKV